MFCVLLSCFVLSQYCLYVLTFFCVFLYCIVMLKCYNDTILLFMSQCNNFDLCLVTLFINVILLILNVTILIFCFFSSRFVMLNHCFIRYNFVLFHVMLFCNNATLFYRLKYSVVTY